MKIIETNAKEIFTKTSLPGADYVINQYVGCSHKCSYCYAKFMSRWKKHGLWGDWVEAKINAPELVKNRNISGIVFMSSVSDAYQPVEKELKLTRKILENLNKNTQLSILTKSDLVTRDIDLFKQFDNIEVGLTINTFENKTKELFEPDSISNSQRIEALKTLRENNIKNYAFISPMIPGLIDLDHLLNQTKDFVDYYWIEVINLRGAGNEFSDMLQTHFPESYKIVTDRKLFDKYMEDIKIICNRHNITIRGFEKH